MLPIELKQFLVEKSLKLLRKQWGQLGVWHCDTGKSGFHSDPETVIAYSMYFSIYDSEIGIIAKNWMEQNPRFVNMSRLSQIKRHQKKDLEFKNKTSVNSSQDINSFLSALNMKADYNLLLRLRLIFGCNTKSEILFFLLNHNEGNSNQIAIERFQNQKAVYNSLQDLALADILTERRLGNSRMYKVGDKLKAFVENGSKRTINLTFFLFTITSLLEKILTGDKIDQPDQILSSLQRYRKNITSSLYAATKISIENTESSSQFYVDLVSILKDILSKDSQILKKDGESVAPAQLSVN